MKISFIGLPGSGKTTLANKLSNELGIETVNIDKLFDKHPLFFFSKRLYRRAYTQYLKDKDSWIIDGYHGSKQPDSVWLESDVIIVMDVERKKLLKRVYRRYKTKKLNQDKSHWQHTFINVIRNWSMIVCKLPHVNSHISKLRNDQATCDAIVVCTETRSFNSLLKEIHQKQAKLSI